ncbi:MAG: DNA polymerase IV [Burkholderiales bacterium]
MARRWIAHLDMDAFYASVELLRYPELRGKPVVVGGRRAHQPEVLPDGSRKFSILRDYAGRGVVTTATYEARKFGIHSALGLMKAAALAPQAVLLPADFDEYRKYSRLFKSAVGDIASQIEDRGIDEIYIDLTDVPGAQDATAQDPHAGVRALAREIKENVKKTTGLTCSIGVTPNKLLSKLCSELEKPDGLTVLTHGDIPARIWPLAARSINGIGPKAAARLTAMGIRTIGDIAATDVLRLTDEFGANYALWLNDAAHGRDERPLVAHREAKSLSHETTFERDLHAREDRETLSGIFTRLCEQVAADLVRKGYVAKTIGVKLRFDDFSISMRELTLPAHTQDAKTIRLWAGRCLKKQPLQRRIRLLGVRTGNLRRADLLPPTSPVQDESALQLDLPLADS